jgi:perosamine synthetase
MPFIPVSEPDLTGNEKKYLAECIDTGWISSDGPFVSRFENLLSKRVNRKFGIAVSSGSAALEIAVTSLGLKPKDEIIIPTFTIISCASAVVRSGLTPVVVDCDPSTWNLDVNKIEEQIGGKTRAIMVVHIYGLPVDMNPVVALAKQYNLLIIEDAAQAIGQTYHAQPCGSLGIVSIFSFYPNKNITTGEGGMILSDDPGIANRCRSLRNLCFRSDKRFVHHELGWNYRMTNMQAAIGLAQIERLDDFLLRKQMIGQHYKSLVKTEGLQHPLEATSFAKNHYWVYGIVLEDKIPFDGEHAIKMLKKEGVDARPFFWPIHQQPVFENLGLFSKGTFPVAERIARRGLYIPSGLTLTDQQLRFVSDTINEIL